MSEALEILYSIYSAFIEWIFNRATIFEGVTIGWIAMVVFVFSVLINSIINIARSGTSHDVNAQYKAERRKEARRGN